MTFASVIVPTLTCTGPEDLRSQIISELRRRAEIAGQEGTSGSWSLRQAAEYLAGLVIIQLEPEL